MMPFGLKIAIINRAFRKKLDEKAAALGLTAVQLRVLGSISRLEAAGETEIHQNDLERIEHVTHPAMTKLLQRLESKQLIRCVPSERDRRYKNHLHRAVRRNLQDDPRAGSGGLFRAVQDTDQGTAAAVAGSCRHDPEKHRRGIGRFLQPAARKISLWLRCLLFYPNR